MDNSSYQGFYLQKYHFCLFNKSKQAPSHSAQNVLKTHYIGSTDSSECDKENQMT